VIVGERYRLEQPLSTGGMGVVFRARDTATGEPVAVKQVLDPRHATQFEIEARLLSALEHPRVVRVLDHVEADEGGYLVMALIDGPDLGRLLGDRGRPGLPVDEAIEYARQVCEALAYVHRQNIVHLDVKPQNMILGEDGIVLVDFGIAAEFERPSPSTSRVSHGAATGTPHFMAPEVFAGEAASPRSDVYGLAASLWTLLAGRPPVYGRATALPEQVKDVRPGLEEALVAGLALLPGRRLASVEAFARALGAPLVAAGAPLTHSLLNPLLPRDLLEAVVRTAAAVFEASAASIALVDPTTGELVYQAAWGAGAREIVGVRLAPGAGIAGSVVTSGDGVAVPACRQDARFAADVAAGTGYVPNTMAVVPLCRDGEVLGVLSMLDRRGGGPYTAQDLPRAMLFAELAVISLGHAPAGAPDAVRGR